MQRVTGNKLEDIRPYFVAAAEVACRATCHRAKCGSVIVSDGDIIGEGYNGPAFDDEANRTCDNVYDLSVKPEFDKTCCLHAEWQAILDTYKRNSDKISGSVLYFMRVDENGKFTDAGEPYCTTCSRLALASEVGWFALWNANGADIYDTAEYNHRSFEYFKAT